MSTGSLLLALLAALSWGALDALRKQLAGAVRPAPLSALLVLGQLPAFALWLGLSPAPRLEAAYWPWGLVDAGLALGASLLFLRALAAAPLSTSIPMLSLTPAFSVLSAWLLVGEEPSAAQLGGIGLVVGGALLLQRPAPGMRWLASPGAWMMVGVAAIWALTLTVDKRALAYASTPVHALTQAALMVMGLLLGLGLQGRLGEVRVAARQRWVLLLPAVACLCLATGAQLLAVQGLLVSLVEALKRAVGLILALTTGRLLFGEPVTRSKLLAVGLMVVGVVLMAAGGGAGGGG